MVIGLDMVCDGGYMLIMIRSVDMFGFWVIEGHGIGFSVNWF